jgi:hypothetical protein
MQFSGFLGYLNRLHIVLHMHILAFSTAISFNNKILFNIMVLLVEPEKSSNGDANPLQQLWMKIKDGLKSLEGRIKDAAKSHEGNHLDQFNRLLFSILVFILLIGMIPIVFAILWNSWGCITEKGTVIQPFEIDSGNFHNISGESLANRLCFELTRIEAVRLGPDASFRSSSNNQKPYFSRIEPSISNQTQISGFKTPNNETFKPTPSKLEQAYDFSPCTRNNIVTFKGMSPVDDKQTYDVGKIDMSGVSLSLGLIIPFLKELTQNQGNTITGSLQQYGSTLRLVAIFYNPDLQGQNKAWEESRVVLPENESSIDEAISDMVKNLSYKIELSFLKDKDNNYPQTWQSYKYLTQGWEACHLYNATIDDKDLEMSGRMALLAKKSEPYYKESDKLLSYIESIWNSKGITHYNLGEYDAALKCYDHVIEIDKIVAEINHQAEAA